jgi:uncharacterized membrane protein YhaH (DUF805 family)
MMKLFCPQCGAKLPPDSKFCTSCGCHLQHEESAEPVKMQTIEKPQVNTGSALDQAMKKIQESDWDGLQKIIKAELFTCDGRISRGDYIKKFLFLLFSIIPLIIIFVFLVEFLGDFVEDILTLLLGIIMVFINISYLMLSIRRLHDLNKSGWLILIAVVPLIDIAFFIYLLACQGTSGPNDFGPEPES